MRPILLLAAALVVAGCVQPPPLGTVDTAIFEDPLVETHDHADPASHALWTPSMELLAFDALGDEPNVTRGMYGEIDIQGDTAYIAVLGDGGETPGLLIVDISERASPRIISFMPSLGSRMADVKGESENEFVFLGAERSLPTTQNRVVRTATDLQRGVANGTDGIDGFRTRNGVRVVDVRDPAAPHEVAFAPSDSGCHMVFHKQYAGGEWVFCVGVGINIYAFDRDGPSIDLVSRYAPLDPETTGAIVQSQPTDPMDSLFSEATPHDITIQDDPLTGQVLMYASYWDLGLRIVDVSDPTEPVELSSWAGQGGERYAGNLHTAMAYVTPEGKRLVYAIPELFSGDDVPAVFIVDATDISSPTLIGEWAAPGDHPNDAMRFSLHNFQIVHHKMYLAYYHGGVWVLDLHGEHATAPEILGYYLPHETVTMQRPGMDVPDVWDVVLKDGYIYATDIGTGLYVLHHEGDMLGDAALTSTA